MTHPEPANDVSILSSMDNDAALKLAMRVYGKEAATADANCAIEARMDGRQQDYRFWFDIFQRLVGAGHA